MDDTAAHKDFVTTDVLARNVPLGDLSRLQDLLARLDPMHLVGAFAALDVLWMV